LNFKGCLKLKAKRQKLEACIGELLVFCWMSQTFQNENAQFLLLDGKITYKFCMCYNEDTPKIRKARKAVLALNLSFWIML
jgi:hypothetical protein